MTCICNIRPLPLSPWLAPELQALTAREEGFLNARILHLLWFEERKVELPLPEASGAFLSLCEQGAHTIAWAGGSAAVDSFPVLRDIIVVLLQHQKTPGSRTRLPNHITPGGEL